MDRQDESPSTRDLADTAPEASAESVVESATPPVQDERFDREPAPSDATTSPGTETSTDAVDRRTGARHDRARVRHDRPRSHRAGGKRDAEDARDRRSRGGGHPGTSSEGGSSPSCVSPR